MTNFERAFKEVIMVEGGYVNDPLDAGGKTKYGITEAVARSYGYSGDMKDLSLSFAKYVYRKGYWDINRLDEIDDFDIQNEIFECGVNRGIRKPVLYAQKAYNALVGENALAEDGIMGKRTIKAINEYRYKSSLVNLMNILQGYSYYAIARNNPSQSRFLKGWLRQRVKLKK